MKFKKRLAVLLSAAIVMGMTVPTGATVLSTNEVPGSGSSTGEGKIEAHLEKEAINIILPTISSDAFNFTVDPERLVAATDGIRFTEAGQELKEGAADAGVFFLVSENSYDSRTPEFAFENRSSFAIDLAVQVEAQHNREATDLALLSQNELGNASEAGLYLGLKVGTGNMADAETAAIKYDAPTKLSVSVNGVDGNFQVSWNSTDKKYVYEEKDTASGWSSGKFQVEGEATRGIDIAENTSAPIINVTWIFKKYGAADPLNQVRVVDSDIYVKVISSVIDSEKLTSVKVNGATVSDYTVNASTGVIKLAGLASEEGKYKVEVTYDGVEYEGSDTK